MNYVNHDKTDIFVTPNKLKIFINFLHNFFFFSCISKCREINILSSVIIYYKYYQDNKEILQKRAHERYQSLSNEEKKGQIWS